MNFILSVRVPFWISLTSFAMTAAPAWAVDRVRAGQWEMTIEGLTSPPMKICVPAAQANAMNGDEKQIREYYSSSTEMSGCTQMRVKASGNQVVTEAVCNGAVNRTTTTFHGDSWEQAMSDGTKVRAKRIGNCP